MIKAADFWNEAAARPLCKCGAALIQVMSPHYHCKGPP